MDAKVQERRVGEFFSRFSQNWDELYGEQRNLFWRVFDHTFRRDIYERFKLTFDELGADLRGKTILDVGCGSGVYSVEAARRGARRVIGVDVAAEMIALARRRSQALSEPQTCEFVCSAFPPPEPVSSLQGVFDAAIVMGVMDYIPGASKFLEQLRPFVRGFAVLSFPGQHWLRGPIREHRYRLLGRCAVYTYSQESIERACRDAGFSRTVIHRLDHSGICYFVVAHA